MKGYKISFLIGCVLIVLATLFASTATNSAIAYNNAYSTHSIITPTPIYRDLHHGIFTNESVYSLHLDSTSVRLTIPFTITDFAASSPDDIFQMATSVQYEPFLEVRLIALPISSTQLINYVLGISEGEKYTSFNQALDNTRKHQNSVPQAGHEIYMFGEEVRSISNLVSLNINQDIKEPVVIHEWLTQHNERLWIFRISYGQESSFADSRLRDVSISMENSQTVLHLVDQPIPEQLTPSPHTPSTPNDLPFPPWWNGDCDVNNFPGSYPLGGIYNGVKACGPLGTTRQVSFGVGVDQFEWQCPELSKRYLYLAYGTPPYSAHGKDVVWYYPDTDLEKVPNGTPNKAPKSGSVLSYGSTDPYGHTSIVSSANIDGSGNGTITVIEQNMSSSGTRTHTVSNWVVQASMAVSGWLYEPGGGACAAPSLIEPADNAVLSSRTITFRWNAVSGCTFNGYTFRVCTSSDVDNLANCFIDTGEGNTQRTETIDGHDNQDLWWGVRAANAPSGASWAVRKFRIEPGGGACAAPSLIEPADNAVLNNQTITFRWNAVSGCTFNGYTFRVCTSSDVDNLANCFIDTGEGNTQRTETINGHDNQDLWWGVRAANAPSGASWAVRRFRIEPGGSSCNPNADQIALFVDSNYGGQCVVKDVGEYSNPSAIGLPNDSTSSIKVGGNVQAILCKDDNYGGGCETFTSDDSNLGDNSIGDNQVSSVKVQWRTTNPDHPIQLYTEPNYGGGSYCYGDNAGNYMSLDGCSGFNDAVTSILLQSGWSVRVFKDVNLGGSSRCLTGSDTDLSNNTFEDGTNLDNAISSFSLYNQANCPDLPPPDTQNPSVNWVTPTGNEQVYNASDNEQINLSVDATDNVGIARVQFYRWDAVNSVFVDIFADYTAPYQVELNSSTLNEGWNQVNAAAYDTSGNIDDKYIWINRLPAPPIANFDAWPHSGTAPLTVAFHNTSTGNYTSCLWEYGDDSTGTSCDDYHDHTYTNPGTYTAKLTVTGPGGSNSKTILDYTVVNAPPDTQNPVLNWTSPVNNGQAFTIGNEEVLLSVTATDNVSIARVRFYRWDAVNSQWREIATDYTPPYQYTLDSTTLNYASNHVYAAAYDIAGNKDERYILIYRKRQVYLPLVVRQRP